MRIVEVTAAQPMETLLIFFATGAAAGLLAGLFGVGGGLIMVPALALALPASGVPAAVLMQVAVATSLAVIAMTSIASTRAHRARGGVHTGLLRAFAPGLALGALGGAFVADALASATLKTAVGAGALAVALQMVWPRTAAAAPVSASPLPGTPELLGAGAGIGLLSALVGIGGGSLSVPYLAARGLPMVQAVGTSAAGGIPIAWAGALGFALAGSNASGLPGAHLGYISLSAFAGLASASVLTAPLGARTAHAMNVQQLKKVFALVLYLLAAYMLTKAMQ